MCSHCAGYSRSPLRRQGRPHDHPSADPGEDVRSFPPDQEADSEREQHVQVGEDGDPRRPRVVVGVGQAVLSTGGEDAECIVSGGMGTHHQGRGRVAHVDDLDRPVAARDVRHLHPAAQPVVEQRDVAGDRRERDVGERVGPIPRPDTEGYFRRTERNQNFAEQLFFFARRRGSCL